MKIAPSMAAADPSRLGWAVQTATRAGADLIHFDLEDGVFLPNITFGPRTVKALRSYSGLTYDVHVELSNPEPFLAELADAGANVVTVHVEACPYLHRTVENIRRLGMTAGVAFNAVTSLDPLQLVLDRIGVIHLMTSDPDHGGGEFLPATIGKIAQAKRIAQGHPIEVEVDGGINPANIPDVVRAGATVLVIGRAIWDSPDPVGALTDLRAIAMNAASSMQSQA